MPQVINAAARWVANAAAQVAANAGASAATAATIASIAYYGFQVGATLAVTMGLGAVARSQLPDPEAGKFTRRQARPPRTVAMGDASRMSGQYMLREAVDEYLGLVVALNDDRLHEISAVYLNDDLAVRDVNGWVQQGEGGRYGSGDLVQIKTRLGLPTETWFSELGAKFGAWWTSDHRGDGIASLMVLAHHKSAKSVREHFPNGELVPSAVGLPVCYDWRDPGQSLEDPLSWGPCSNPIVWLAFNEWRRQGRSWTRFIEPVLADLTAEADYCDELVATKAGGTERRYRFGGWYPVDVEPRVWREAVLAACDGWMTTDGRGRLVIKAGRYTAPTFTLTGDHILGYDWRRGTPAEETINRLDISFVDPAQHYTEIPCDPWIDETSVTRVGRERAEPLRLNWVQSLSQARRLAKRKVSRLQAGRRGQIIADMDGLNALGHRYIRVQNPELASMADIVVEVMQIEPDLMSGTVTLEVILADQNIDAWNPATEEGEAVGTVDRPQAEPLAAPTIDSLAAFFEDAGTGIGVRLAIQGMGPDRGDLTWFAGWRVAGDASWAEAEYTDAAEGSPVMLETSFVPSDVLLEVRIAYGVGSGFLSPWSTPAEIGPVSLDLLVGADGDELVGAGGARLIGA